MAALAEAATNSTRLAEELDQERAAAYSSWSWSTAFTVLGVLVWLFRWGWAVLAAHFPRFPKAHLSAYLRILSHYLSLCRLILVSLFRFISPYKLKTLPMPVAEAEFLEFYILRR